MKYTYHFSILVCIMSILFTSCDSTDIPKTNYDNINKIEGREIMECSECPTGDCCCAVWLQDPIFGYANLYLCGTSDGSESCNGDAIGLCSSFSGGGQGLELIGTTNPRRGFCVDPGDAFWIVNAGSTTAYIYVTCQYDESDPQTLTLTIPANTRVYIGSNGSCIIEPC